MPSQTFTWHFTSGWDGWQVSTGGGTGITYGLRTTDGAPGSANGCIYVRRDGQNLTDGYVQVFRSQTMASLGIPANAVITRIAATAYGRCSDWSNGGFSWISDGYFANARIGILSRGGYISYSGVTSWEQRPTQSFDVNLLATETLNIIFEVQPRTANVSGAYVELRLDYVQFSVDYVVPDPEPSATPSVLVGASSTDITQYVAAESLVIERGCNGAVSTARFRANAGVLSDPLQSLLASGVRCQIKSGSLQLFDGEIASVEIKTDSRATRYDVLVRDVVAQMARVAVLNASWSSTTVGNIVTDIVLNYCGSVLSQDTSFISDNRSVASFTVQADDAVAALRALASAYPAIWYVDSQRRLHWRAISAPEASGRAYSISPQQGSAEILADSITVSHDMGRLANHVTVISSQDSVTTTQWSGNPPAGGDDAYLSGTSTSWPVPNASGINNNSAFVRVLAANTANVAQLQVTPTLSYYCYTGSSWTPATVATPTSGWVQCSYASGNYTYQTIGVAVTLPNRSDPIISAKLRFTVSNTNNHSGDSVNLIFVDRVYYYQIDDRYPFPISPYYDYAYYTLADIPYYEHSIGNVQWNTTYYFRIGLYEGAPTGFNQAQITNVVLYVDYQDLSSSSYSEDRIAIRFDTSPIPDGASVTQAELKLYALSGQNQSWATMQAYVLQDASSAPSTSWWSASSTFASHITPASGWNSITIPPSLINKTGYTGLLLRYSASSTPPSQQGAYWYFSSSESATNKPQLAVTYVTVTQGVSATAQDTASQSQYGVRKLVIPKPGISQGECARIAAEELGKRAWPMRSISVQTTNGFNAYPGQTAYVNASPYLSANFYAITRITCRHTATGWRYSIELIGGQARLETYLLEVLK